MCREGRNIFYSTKWRKLTHGVEKCRKFYCTTESFTTLQKVKESFAVEAGKMFLFAVEMEKVTHIAEKCRKLYSTVESFIVNQKVKES